MNKSNNLYGKKPKVLIGLSEIEGHDRGTKYVITSLKNAGMEVVLVLYQTIQDVVRAALQEDVDIIGISSYTGAHMTTMSDLTKLLKEKGLEDTLVLLGGIIPTEDRPVLKEMGVDEIFGPGTTSKDIINFISSWAYSARNAKRGKRI